MARLSDKGDRQRTQLFWWLRLICTELYLIAVTGGIKKHFQPKWLQTHFTSLKREEYRPRLFSVRCYLKLSVSGKWNWIVSLDVCCLAVYWQHLQRPGAVRFVGMFRWVQPYLGRSSVGRRCPSQVHPRRRSTEENRLQLLDGRYIAHTVCRYFYHDEPRLRWKNRTTREPESTFQVDINLLTYRKM